MGEIFTRLIKLPPRIKGYTAIDDDGNYNIYLNEKRAQKKRVSRDFIDDWLNKNT